MVVPRLYQQMIWWIVVAKWLPKSGFWIIDPPGFNLIQCMAHVASNCLPIHFSAYSNFRAYPKIRYLSANTTTILLKNTYLVLVLPGLVMGHITPIFCLFENLYYFLKYSLQIFGKIFDFSS